MSSAKKSDRVMVRIEKSTLKNVCAFLEELNDGRVGKKIRADKVIAKAVSKLTPEHLEEIAEESLTNADRIEIGYQEYCKSHGEVTKDEYLGTLIQRKI